MKKSICFSGFLACIVLFGGCGKPTLESITQDLYITMNSVSDILATIVDEATAREAVPKLKSLDGKMQEIADSLERVRDTSNESDRDKAKEYSEKMKDATTRYIKEIERISGIPEAMRHVGSALKKDIAK